MLIEVKVPSVGESVTEAVLAQWYKNDGEMVKKDEPLFVIETDKVTLEVVADASGVLSIKVAEGETVAIGAVVATIDMEAAPETAETPPADEKPEAEPVEQEIPTVPEAAIESIPAPDSKMPEPTVPEPLPASVLVSPRGAGRAAPDPDHTSPRPRESQPPQVHLDRPPLRQRQRFLVRQGGDPYCS